MKLFPKIKSPVSLLLLILLFSSIAFKTAASVGFIKQKTDTIKADNQLPCEESEKDSEDEKDTEKEGDDLFKDFIITFISYSTWQDTIWGAQGSNHYISFSVFEGGQSEIPVYLSIKSIRV